jgi:signal transduction histidine kinase
MAFVNSSQIGLVPGRFGIGWLFSVALVPGILAGSLLLYEVYQSERAQLEQGARQTSRALAQALDGELAGIQGQLQILATSPYLREGDFPAFYRQAQEILTTETLAGAIVLIDPTGQQVMNTMRPLGAQLPKTGNPDMLQRIFKTGRPAVSDLHIGGVARNHFVALQAPVWREGRVIYVLGMGIDPARLNEILAAQNLPKGWVTCLVDRQGVIVARSQNAARSVGQKVSAELIEQMGKNNEGSLASRTPEGEPAFVAFSRSAASGWTTAVVMQRNVLNRNFYGPLALIVLTMAAFIATGAALARFLSQQVREALQTLGVATEAAAAGDLGAVAPLAGPREIARLAAQFNSMQEARKNADATERRLAKFALQDTEERLKEGMLVARMVVWDWDLETDKVRFPDNTPPVFGDSWNNMTSIWEWIHEDDRQRLHDARNDAIVKRGSYQEVIRFIGPVKGELLWLQVCGKIVCDEIGNPQGIRGVAIDVTERKLAEEALQLSHEKLRELVAYQERIKENERIRIAREIHDELGGVLTGIKANLSFLMDQDERAGSVPNPCLLDACVLLDAAVDTVRKVITDLRPSVLDQLGVWTALEWYVGQTEARSGLSCRFTIDPSAAQSVIDPERSTALFRILQETLTNVARHADASQVEIRVMHVEGSIRMEVEDNGKGIDAGQMLNRKSWGIAGMAERARSFGGDIRITDTSHGTLLVLRLPLENPND